MNKDFTEEFNRMWNKILSKTPMAYTRYADGEVALMQGRKVNHESQAFRVDRWSSMGDGITEIGKDLLETLNHTDPEYYYAISCKCCDPNGQKWLLDNIKQKEENITYSNLWINSNYKLFMNAVGQLSEQVYLISNKRGAEGMYPFDVCGFYGVDDECVKLWSSQKSKIISDMTSIAKEHNNTLYFISAGPLSELLIHHLWLSNPNNRYIDVGSAIDEFVHLTKTRPFMMEDTYYFNMKCQF